MEEVIDPTVIKYCKSQVKLVKRPVVIAYDGLYPMLNVKHVAGLLLQKDLAQIVEYDASMAHATKAMRQEF